MFSENRVLFPENRNLKLYSFTDRFQIDWNGRKQLLV